LSSYHTSYIGLGSNLENPQAQINSAIKTLAGLPQCRDLACSHYYISKAIGPGKQPDYINAVAKLDTQLSPLALLKQLQNIEDSHGRQRNIRWGARTLDLDLLLYENIGMDTEELQLPHPEMANRNFVLYPLQDIAPKLLFPDGQSLASMTAKLPMSDLSRIEKQPI
jgi:2-amino-4-hydroxy-6-hydroxymethyldihydropteridine diphosphokinase